MTTTVTLEYKRDEGAVTSTGRLLSNDNGLITEEGSPFTSVEFPVMLGLLCDALGNWPPEDEVAVVLQRTDRAGLLPYTLDKKTVTLLRTDREAGIKSFDAYVQSPSTSVQRTQEERVKRVAAPIRAGQATLADSFGDQLFFRVRAHELECPGCGFWGMFISPGLLKDPERAGTVVKTAFVCPKKCKARVIVTCDEKWGYVDTKYLLDQTTLQAFFFPRGWNEGHPWVSRESLQQKYDEYKTAKEQLPCLDRTT
jgi:hypothetical protein